MQINPSAIMKRWGLFTKVSFVCFSIYSGHHSILIPPSEVEINPALWLSIVGQYKGMPLCDKIFVNA